MHSSYTHTRVHTRTRAVKRCTGTRSVAHSSRPHQARHSSRAATHLGVHPAPEGCLKSYHWVSSHQLWLAEQVQPQRLSCRAVPAQQAQQHASRTVATAAADVAHGCSLATGAAEDAPQQRTGEVVSSVGQAASAQAFVQTPDSLQLHQSQGLPCRSPTSRQHAVHPGLQTSPTKPQHPPAAPSPSTPPPPASIAHASWLGGSSSHLVAAQRQRPPAVVVLAGGAGPAVRGGAVVILRRRPSAPALPKAEAPGEGAVGRGGPPPGGLLWDV